MTTGDPARQGSAATDLADAFGRAGKALVRALDERLGQQGVSTPRARLLAEVLRLGPVRLTELARAVGITQGTASTLVDGLVREGLVTRRVDDADRRATRIDVTSAGRVQARRWLRDYAAAAEEVLDCLTRAEQRALTDLLTRLGDALTDARPEG